MKFNSWELLAIEKSLELGIKEGRIEKISGTALLKRFQKEEPRKVKGVDQ